MPGAHAFPGLLVLVSIIGLSGRSTTQTVRDNPRLIAPTGVNPFLRTVIEQVRAPVDSHRRV